MSYDLYLRDPVTKKELQVPAHMMYGGNIRCDVVGGQLVPTTTTEAYLNITYNYGRYYYEAFPDDKDHAGQHEDDCGRYGIDPAWSGIYVLNGLSGVLAIPVLEEMIRRIKERYMNPDGSWSISKRERRYFINRDTGQREGEDFMPLLTLFNMKKKALRTKRRKSGLMKPMKNTQKLLRWMKAVMGEATGMQRRRMRSGPCIS